MNGFSWQYVVILIAVLAYMAFDSWNDKRRSK